MHQLDVIAEFDMQIDVQFTHSLSKYIHIMYIRAVAYIGFVKNSL